MENTGGLGEVSYFKSAGYIIEMFSVIMVQ